MPAIPWRNLSAVRPEVTQNPALGTDDQLLRLVLAYLPIAAGGAVLSFVYDVGAHPGGDPAEDIFLRGTPLVPPLFLPTALVAAGLLTRRGGSAATTGEAIAGIVGLAFLAGTTFNLPNDFDAARAAGSPIGLTVATAVVHAALGLGLARHAIAVLRRRPASTTQTTVNVDSTNDEVSTRRPPWTA